MKRALPNRPPIVRRKKTDAPPSYHNAWLSHHLYVFFSSLGQFIRAPLSNLMTAAVIGIALALPAGLYLLLENVQQLSREWSGSVQITLFLRYDVQNAQAQTLAQQLSQYNEIKTVSIITREQALAEYRQLSGFADALSALEENPLPIVLIVYPKINQLDTEENQALLDKLTHLPEVEVAQFDMNWLKRLIAVMELIRQGVFILASLLALSVLLIVGNTIRLAIDNRREEIEINKLFGATDAFIRRPFLYSGLWYGLSGSIIAWILISVAFWLLRDPAKQLAVLYHSQFDLVTLNWSSSVIILLSGMLLGLAGAWLAVGRHLKDIQPR